VNSSSFLASFSKIERRLRGLAGAEGAHRHRTFLELVTACEGKHTVVRRHSTDLREYADLRNAIVHERSDGHVIAEPNERAVRSIAQIAALLCSPPPALPIASTPVLTLPSSEPLAHAVSTMAQKSFSQIPVVDANQCVGLLTATTIARWLGAHVSDDIVSLGETTVRTVLSHQEHRPNHAFLGRKAVLYDVLDAFEGAMHTGRPLDAVLFTDTGRATEKLLGIVTLSDIPEVYAQSAARPSDSP